ncbi:MAG: beta-lactamase family protein [Minwuiales bacterium]|nr:beta-lactamase family protein [Minwuiales bacterium]
MTRRAYFKTARRAAGLAAVLALTLANSTPGSANNTMLDQARSAAERKAAELLKRGLPGALVGISAGAGQTKRIAIGVADITTGAPLRVDHTMRIGSLAKLVVGTLALQLVDEGRIRLSDPVSNYVGDIPNGDRITLHMLGTHKSGLFNPIADPAFRTRINADPGAEIPFSAIVDVARRHPIAPASGRAFSYSNANTVLLARTLETATGKSLAELIETRVRQPFGVDTPFIPKSAALADPELRGYRYGERAGAVEYGTVLFDATEFSASWAGAAGNMNATLEDLLVLAKPLASGATLSDDTRAVLHSFEPVAHGFEYGFQIARFGDAIGHAGDVPGFSSFLAWLPSHDLSIVVLCNLSNMSDKRAPAEIIGRSIINELGKPSDER